MLYILDELPAVVESEVAKHRAASAGVVYLRIDSSEKELRRSGFKTSMMKDMKLYSRLLSKILKKGFLWWQTQPVDCGCPLRLNVRFATRAGIGHELFGANFPQRN